MKQFYPYTLAINTSSMGLNAQVLINLSNKFVLAYDNDSAGQEGIKRDKRTLRNLGAQVTSIELDKTTDENGKFLIKDCSDYLNFPNKIPKLKEELYYKIKRVNSF
jgi:DNA primase